MKILHNQSGLKRGLFVGIGYIVIGLLSLITSMTWYLSGLIGIGILYLAQYFYLKDRAYVILDDSEISTNGFVKKHIRLEDITSRKYFAGDYIIKSVNQEIIIDTNLVDKRSKEKLKTYFDTLNFPQPAANTR